MPEPNYFEILTTGSKKYKQANIEDKVIKKRIREIEEQKNKEMQPLLVRSAQLSAASSELYDQLHPLKEKIKYFARFDMIDIAYYITRLVTFIEGKEYYYYRSYEKNSIYEIGYHNISYTSNGGYMLLTKSAFALPEDFEFYKENGEAFDLVWNMTLDAEYSYVKQYIDALIIYLIDHNITKSLEDIPIIKAAALTVLNQFVHDNEDLMKEKYNQRRATYQAERNVAIQDFGSEDFGKK